MTAVLLDGDALAVRWRADIAARTAALAARGIVPGLATILMGDDPASAAYVGRKHADCAETGIASRDIRLPAATREAELIARIEALNADPAIHGIVVQLPLPEGLDTAAATFAVDSAKDVDGLHILNLGRLLAGEPGLRPCTPKAILAMLGDHGVPLAGRRVAVIGRGPLVGRPLALMLADPAVDAVVTVLHRGAPDIAGVLKDSDVIVSAAGSPGLVTAAMVRPGAAVIGVGITYVDGAMVSDIAPDVAAVAGHVTPPHGSVGPLTRAMLLRNLLDVAENAGRGG